MELESVPGTDSAALHCPAAGVLAAPAAVLPVWDLEQPTTMRATAARLARITEVRRTGPPKLNLHYFLIEPGIGDKAPQRG
jgi:hypothetical protein